MSPLRQALSTAQGSAQYDVLPESIKMEYTPKEWMWLSDSMKAGLIRNSTEPEWTE